MTSNPPDSSVFTDDSGRRRRLVSVLMASAVGLLALGAAAATISVFGHVTLPGLDQPLRLPGTSSVNPSADQSQSHRQDGGAKPDRAVDGTATSPTPAAGSAERPTTGVSPTPSATDAPTTAVPTPSGLATGRPTAKPTTAVQPTHARPTAPPGQSKSPDTAQ